ncbi:MAG: NADH-quinone oxidoreductase subunit NuoE [bacterium]
MEATKTVLSPEARREAESLMKKYPDPGAALLPILHIAQREFGHISTDVEEYVAALTGLSTTRVHGVVSFYTMYRKAPGGKYLLQLCTNVSCTLAGAEDLLGHLIRRLGVSPGETTPDGKFTLLTVECLGACGSAPAMQINDDYHEELTAEKIDRLLDSLV